MNKRQLLVMAAVLVVGLMVGSTAGRFQAGRYAVHFVQDKGSVYYVMCRYDTYTGKTWTCRAPYGLASWWTEVPESEGDAKAAEAEAKKKAAESVRGSGDTNR